LQETQEVEAPNLESSKLVDKEINLSVKTLLLVYLSMFLVFALLLPKIYIGNQIYYLSKEINTLYHKYTALEEERDHLQKQLELVRYKVQILDNVGSVINDTEESSERDQ
jgi:cell division protein FtsL